MPAIRTVMGLLLLSFSMLFVACTPTQVMVPKIEVRSPHIPEAMLTCLPRPNPPAEIRTQADVMDFLATVDTAGQDCRLKLQSVRNLLNETR